MSYRLTRIYTGKGDKGLTTLGGNTLPKDDLLIEALGTIDELNSVIGFIISLQISDKKIEACLTQIQNDLFDLGGELHLPERIAITPEKISQLEQSLNEWNNLLPPLKEFLLPRGNPKSAATHIARTVCRRAERAMVKLHRQISLNNPEMLRYLNRLSDVLFVIARMLARETNEKELMWEHP
ncbi:MAG: cob(I)yrinic acid a,c-diamide adenosyltransferase [Gammaproteobacteria bacterium]|nr:cob(I)yrinic acid a,c-diamide adenosyltransferase [Gammaproteobacteria bacterium]MCW5582301.1 cob(I)yrinic acid a,c-diamide adenosyltransferase [Gammaproteobacteria bacterium]